MANVLRRIFPLHDDLRERVCVRVHVFLSRCLCVCWLLFKVCHFAFELNIGMGISTQSLSLSKGYDIQQRSCSCPRPSTLKKFTKSPKRRAWSKNYSVKWPVLKLGRHEGLFWHQIICMWEIKHPANCELCFSVKVASLTPGASKKATCRKAQA